MARVVVIGAGGIGAPLAITLVEAGLEALTVVDDDVVELSNLHRQIAFDEGDVGRPKLDALGDALRARAPGFCLEAVRARATPTTVGDLVGGATVVVDACDNYPTRFLLADACHLAGVPVVHAAAVQWQATVMACAGVGAPCYRCLFEDLPRGATIDCASGGVAGPVCGVAGALAADAVLQILAGGAPFGRVVTYDGWGDRLRAVPVTPRRDCELCSDASRIGTVDASRYTPPSCSVTAT